MKKLIRIERPLESRCLHEHPDQEPIVDGTRQRRLRLADQRNDWVGGGKQGWPEEQIPKPAGRQASPRAEALDPYLESEVCEHGQPNKAKFRRRRAVAAVDVRRGKLKDGGVGGKLWYASRIAQAHPEGMLVGDPNAAGERAEPLPEELIRVEEARETFVDGRPNHSDNQEHSR